MSHIGRIRLDGTHDRPHWLETEEQPFRIASDSSHVFWASGLDSITKETLIARANVDGTGLDEDWVTLDGLPFDYFVMGMVSDGTYLYLMVTELEDGSNASRAFIARIKISNGALDLEWHTTGIDPAYQGLAVGAAHLYWTREISVGESWVARLKTDGTGLETEWIKIPEGFFPSLVADSEFLWGHVDNGISVADLSEPTPTFEPFSGEAEMLEGTGEPTAAHLYFGVFIEGAPGSDTGTSEEGYLYYVVNDEEVEEEEKEERPESSSKIERLKRTDGTDQGHFYIPHIIFGFGVAEFPFEVGEPEEGGEEEEPPTNVVKVKVGGELIDARRYVKVGGELIPA